MRSLSALILFAYMVFLPVAALSQVSMKLYSDTPSTHPKSQLLASLATQIRDRTEGRIVADFFSADSDLFPNEDIALDALVNNQVQMVWPPVARLERFAPEFMLLTLPYSIDLFAIRDANGHAVLIDDLSNRLHDVGLDILGLAPAGYTLFVSKDPLTSVDQLPGKTVRVPGSPMLTDYLETIGAKGVNFPAPELPKILGDKSVDVVLTSFAGWDLIGPTDGEYVLVDLDMRVGFYGAVLNGEWLASLDGQDRLIVIEEVSNIIAERWLQLEDERFAFEEQMRAVGTTYTEISGDDAAALKTAADAIRRAYIERSPEFIQNYLK